MDDPPSAELLERYRAGDRRAADELFGRYTARLIALARSRLSAKMARRLDPEDVVQSAYRCFCATLGDDRYVLRRGDDLWRLLSAITLHKLFHQLDRHRALKRSVECERGFGGESSLEVLGGLAAAREPSPSDAVALADEVEHLLSGLKPSDRRMVELRLQGHRIESIAAEAGCSERWVRRVLDQAKARLDRREREFQGTC